MFSPKKVHLQKKSNLLTITWGNGEISCISGAKLRQFCACATCRARDVVGQALITDDSQISELKLMGSTGIQIIFQDGHDRGVYPWSYIYAIAQDTALNHLKQTGS